MTDIILKTDIMDIIKREDFNVNTFKAILKPTSEYFGNSNFIDNIERVVTIITTDRNGDNKFNLEDIKLLAKDPFALSSLVTAIILTINSIPNINIKYKVDESERMIFHILIYVFIILVPKKMGKTWSLSEKEQIVDFILMVYQTLQASQLVKDILNKIAKWFQKNGWCLCICSPTVDDDHVKVVVERKMPKVLGKLRNNLDDARDKGA